jgi:1-acyl-sn-glycerol-3-phosphate acyltransferase
VTIALKSGAPILPIGFYGGETFKDHLKRLRRTPFHVRLGTPFRLVAPEGRIRQDVRQSMADEIMCQIAALLPPEYRGVYSEPEKEGTTFLQPVS